MGFRSRRSRSRKIKNTKQAQHRTSMEDLPLDISLDILRRLSITTLIQVKLVSKAWCNLACHPRLTAHYQHLNYPCLVALSPASDKHWPEQLHLIDSHYFCDKDNNHQHRDGFISRIRRPMNHKRYTVSNILSCNGLLCLLCSKNRGVYSDYRVCVSNPLTEEHKFLPDPGLPRVKHAYPDFVEIGAVYQGFGFGFHLRTNEYKVVRICRLFYKNKYERLSDHRITKTEVFTLNKDGYWRSEIDNPFVCPEQSSDAVVNGAIHWLCRRSGPFGVDYWPPPWSFIIVSFDLEEEKFHQIPKPRDCGVDNNNNHLVVLGGCLSIARHHERQVEIWKMKEYGVEDSWNKEFVIRENIPITLESPGLLHPLCLLNNGKILISYKNEAIYCYDPEREWFETIAQACLLPHPFQAILHAASLVSNFL